MLTSWKESYDQLRQHIKKHRYYFANKGPSSQDYGFSMVIHGCESWTIMKAERRIDVFELWCWTRLFRVPWTTRTSNQSILKEISPGCSLEELMLKLKLQYCGHLMQELTLEKTLMLGKIEDGRRRGQQRMRWLDGITNSMDMVWVNSKSWWRTGRPGVLQSMGSQRVGHDWPTELNWSFINAQLKALYSNAFVFLISVSEKLYEILPICLEIRLFSFTSKFCCS